MAARIRSKADAKRVCVRKFKSPALQRVESAADLPADFSLAVVDKITRAQADTIIRLLERIDSRMAIAQQDRRAR